MKKLLAVLLVIAMLLHAAALADYSPGLGMSMSDFITKYNSVQAALESPYSALSKPSSWTVWNGYHLAWFSADKSNTVTILLMTKDPKDAQLLTSGLDAIQIFIRKGDDFVQLISVTDRCASIFGIELLGSSFSGLRVTQVLKSYFENNCREKGLLSYSTLDDNEEIALCFFYDSGYYFSILPLEDI